MKHFLSFTLSIACVLVCVTLSCASPKDKDGAAPKAEVSQSAVPASASAVPKKVGEFRLSPFADSLKKNFYVDLCCASPLEACVAQKTECGLAPRLVSFLEMLDSMKTLNHITNERMVEMMQARHDMFKDTIKYDADIAGWPVIGDAKSPVSVVMYYSVTCPTCKTNFRYLHAEVTQGRLKGKVKIIAKPLNAQIFNLASIAAFDLGHFSEFMFHLVGVGRVEEQILYEIADRLYIDRQVFKAKMENPELLKRVEQSAKESEKNEVNYVPTYFIMGRRYTSSLFPFWIVDAIEYIYETEILKK
jgi:hypothetical protein